MNSTSLCHQWAWNQGQKVARRWRLQCGRERNTTPEAVRHGRGGGFTEDHRTAKPGSCENRQRGLCTSPVDMQVCRHHHLPCWTEEEWRPRTVEDERHGSYFASIDHRFRRSSKKPEIENTSGKSRAGGWQGTQGVQRGGWQGTHLYFYIFYPIKMTFKIKEKQTSNK